jgi:hypothetical protein
MTSNLLRMLIPVTIAFAGTIVQATVPLTPRIVVQFDIQPGVEVAAWTPDDRYVVTGLGVTRTLTIWDAATGIVVDRANIPALSTTGYEEFLRLTSIDISPDGRTATVYAVASTTEPVPRRRVPMRSICRRASSVRLRLARCRRVPRD